MTGYLVAMALVLCGCHLGVRRTDRDPVLIGLDDCDIRLGTSVPDQEQLSDSLQCLLELSANNPEDGRVYAVVARTLDARALMFPDPAVDDLASARSWAQRCLALRPGVAARLQVTGGLIDEQVLAVVPATDAACVVWAGITWSRWLAARGVLGDAIDLDAVQALGSRAVAMDPELDRGRAWEARGLSLAIVPPALGRDAQAASDALAQARQRAPDRLLTAVETAEFIYGPAGDKTAWQRTLQAVTAANGATGGLDALEDAYAQVHAQALLDAGPPEVAPW